MSRQYPRFLFANPKDTKSIGPFVVHTLRPQLIARIIFKEDGGHQVEPLEAFVEADKEEVNHVHYAMYDWFTRHRMKQAKLSEDFYDRMSEIAERLGDETFYHGTVSIGMTFRPKMGAKLSVGKDGKEVSLYFSNDDTFDSVVKKIIKEYRQKYLEPPTWEF